MPVKLHNEFISDLVTVGEANFSTRVLKKVFDNGGKFIDQAKEDHRYKGIPDGWIRKVSKGMRVIYIRDGNDVTLYRAGQHSVEDNLSAPATKDGYAVVSNPIHEAMSSGPGEDIQKYFKNLDLIAREDSSLSSSGLNVSKLLFNHTDRFLYGELLGRRFLPHKDVYLISPSLTPNLLRATDRFGQMLDELIESGACVSLITRPPSDVSSLSFFEELSARKIDVFFNGSINARIFAFKLNHEQLDDNQANSKDFVSIGSATLTDAGLNPSGSNSKDIQYDLSYEIASEDWPEVEDFITRIAALSTELDVVRANLSMNQGTTL